MSLVTGQVCAACVPYMDGSAWILTRIEQRLPSGDFVVCDEYDESQQNLRYTVPANHVAEFPTARADFRAGERILALWYDEEGCEWSTMFYEAVVVDAGSDGKVLVEFAGSAVDVRIDASKIARFPGDFDMAIGAPSAQSDAAPRNSAQRAHTDRSDRASEKRVANGERESTNAKGRKRRERDERKREERKREEQEREEREREEREREEREAEEDVQRVNMQRRVYFVSSDAAQRDECAAAPAGIADSDFCALLPRSNQIRRLHSREGTPLLDLLNDGELFPQSSFHLTVNGKLSVPNYAPRSDCQCGLSRSDAGVGRLSRILHQWRK